LWLRVQWAFLCREQAMPTSQIILLVIFGVVVLTWGALRDIKNHKKEKEAQLTQRNAQR
jgi:hypothetical protein